MTSEVPTTRSRPSSSSLQLEKLGKKTRPSSMRSGRVEPEPEENGVEPIDSESYASTETLPSSSSRLNDRNTPPLTKLYGKIFIGLAFLVILLILILVPLGYHELEYYEMGLYRNKMTGFVDTTKTYFSGRHWLGVNKHFVVYPTDLQREFYSDIPVFTTEKIEVNLTFSFTYKLRYEDLGILHKTYGVKYQPLLRSAALAALKGAAILYSIDEYRLKRPAISKALSDAISTTIGGICCRKDCFVDRCKVDCKAYWNCKRKDLGYFAALSYFQLQRVDITEGQKERFLKQVIEQELEGTEIHKQEEKMIRMETEQLAFEYNNAANEILKNATAESTLLKLRTVAESEKLVEEHRNQGLQLVYNALNVTEEEDKKTLDYVMTLRNQNKASLYLGFQFLVAKP